MQPEVQPDADGSLELPYLIAPIHRQRLDLIHHLLEFGNQIVLIQGAPGSGRTRMLECVCAEAEPSWNVQQIEGAIESPDVLLRFLVDGLSDEQWTEDSDGEELISAIDKALAHMVDDRSLCVLVVDDADDLDEEICTLLFELMGTNGPGGELRVLLASRAESDLEERLQRAAPGPALVHVIDIPELSSDQVREIIESFAREFGDENRLLEIDSDRLARDTGGNPGKVIAELNALGDAPRTSTRIPRARDLKRHQIYAAMLAVAVIAAAAYALFGASERKHKVETVALALPEKNASAMPTTPSDGRNAAVSMEPTEVVVEPVDVASVEARETVDVEAGDAVETVDVDTGDALEPGDSTGEGFTAGAADPASKHPVITMNRGGVSEPPTGPPAALEALDFTAEAAADVPGGAAVTETIAPPAQAPSASLPSAAVDFEPTPESPEEKTYSSKWVLAQDPQSYVIQLFGVRDRNAAVRFIKANDLGLPSAVIATTHERAPWYVLVLGHYPDRDSAKAAIDGLSPPLAALKPWARPIHSLTK